jgi:signal transduction histidine kinase
VPRGATPDGAGPTGREDIVSALASPIGESDRAALKQALDLPADGHRLRADPAVAGAAPTATLIWPVQANDRPYTRIGHLLARVRAAYLWSGDWPARRFGERGHVAVVDSATGDLLYHTRAGWMGRPLRQVDPGLHEALYAPRRAAAGRPWTALGRGVGRRVAGLAPVPGTSWQVAVTATPAEFAHETQRTAVFNLTVAVLVLLAGAGVMIFASGRIARSIHTLTAGVRRIAGGDLTERVIRVETHDEVQTLAEAFNAMTASLRRSIALRDQAAAELDALNRSLESRVQERTRELEGLNAALNQANAELTELDRLKSNFLATVSHEFKTPLTSIKAFAEILHDELEQRDAPAEMRRFLKIIDAESDRLARLIKNVLDLSRIESGRMIWKMTDFPVRQVIDAAVDGLLPALHHKQIRLERELAAGEVRVHADQDRIQEVLANVLDNAIKASEAGQRIVIGCQAGEADGDGQPPMLRIWVRDFGHGIPAEHLEKIFDRFHQVSTHGRRRKGGTGLGLAISREIAEHHGGRIWAESQPGHGATFHIALPLAAAALPPRAVP